MKREDLWTPSKYVRLNGRLRASRDPNIVGIGSRLNVDRLGALFEEHLPTHCCGDLLDLGCGAVPLFGLYRPYAKSVTCVDWEGSLHTNPHIDLCCDLSQPLPLPSSGFDTVILSDVLEHLPNPDLLWDEMQRILRPDGKLILSVPFYYWLHEEPHDYYRYTRHALERYCRLHDFHVLIIVEVGGAPEILADIVAKLSMRFLGRTGRFVAIAVQRISSILDASRRWREFSKRSAGSFPLGYFLVARLAKSS